MILNAGEEEEEEKKRQMLSARLNCRAVRSNILKVQGEAESCRGVVPHLSPLLVLIELIAK